MENCDNAVCERSGVLKLNEAFDSAPFLVFSYSDKMVKQIPF
jgi:hypothetical protein